MSFDHHQLIITFQFHNAKLNSLSHTNDRWNQIFTCSCQDATKIVNARTHKRAEPENKDKKSTHEFYKYWTLTCIADRCKLKRTQFNFNQMEICVAKQNSNTHIHANANKNKEFVRKREFYCCILYFKNFSPCLFAVFFSRWCQVFSLYYFILFFIDSLRRAF